MNNTIVILIDSVFADCLSKKPGAVSVTPFLDGLRPHSLSAHQIFSYGPYTDAATIGLYTGIPTLSNFGYYYGINSSPYNHFRVFKEQGYETYGLFYPYYLISSKVRKYIDHPIYTSGFQYKSVWNGKFKDYATLQKKRPLTEQEYNIMRKCLEMIFDCWVGFYKDIQHNDESSTIVNSLRDETINGKGFAALQREVQQYQKSPKAYLDCILKLGMLHPLAQINEFDYGKAEDKAFLKSIYKQHYTFIKKLKKVNFITNLINNFPSIHKSVRNLVRYIKTRNSVHLRYFGNYCMLFCAPHMMIKRSQTQRGWQVMASFNKQIEVLLENLDKRSITTKPFYASLHVLEPHHNISFFSFDSFDNKCVQEEFDYLQPLLDQPSKHFGGNLLYELSLRYVDLCIKRLMDGLKKRGLAENTTIMLVSDHGTSYFFKPVRTHVVNTFHRENYQIPLLIYASNLSKEQKGDFPGFYMSEDILPTLLSVNGLKIPDQFEGRIIYKDKSRAYVITEYMGPGVPDMLNREVWISVRNSNYVVGYICNLYQQLDLEKPAIVYDLRKDPYEKTNLASKVDVTRIPNLVPLLAALKKRFYEIAGNTDEIIHNFSIFQVCDAPFDKFLKETYL